jgi:hypothetical protein
MIAGVADTHAALWFLFGDPRLSATAKDLIDKAAAGQSLSCPEEAPFAVEWSNPCGQVPRADVPDMPDPHRRGYGPVFRGARHQP